MATIVVETPEKVGKTVGKVKENIQETQRSIQSAQNTVVGAANKARDGWREVCKLMTCRHVCKALKRKGHDRMYVMWVHICLSNYLSIHLSFFPSIHLSLSFLHLSNQKKTFSQFSKLVEEHLHGSCKIHSRNHQKSKKNDWSGRRGSGPCGSRDQGKTIIGSTRSSNGLKTIISPRNSTSSSGNSGDLYIRWYE